MDSNASWRGKYSLGRRYGREFFSKNIVLSNSNGNVRNTPSASRHFQNFHNMHFRKAGREEISSRRSNWLGVILSPLKHALSPPLLNWARSVVIKDIMLDEMILTLTVTEKYIKTYKEVIQH